MEPLFSIASGRPVFFGNPRPSVRSVGQRTLCERLTDKRATFDRRFAMPRRGLRKPPQRKSLRPRSSLPPSRISEGPAAAPIVEPTQATQEWAQGLKLGPIHVDEHEPLTTSFFSRPHADPLEAWDDAPLPGMEHGSRRAMYATLAIFGVSALVVGGYVAYARLVMPVPAELGRSSGLPPSVAIATAPVPSPSYVPAREPTAPPQPSTTAINTIAAVAPVQAVAAATVVAQAAEDLPSGGPAPTAAPAVAPAVAPAPARAPTDPALSEMLASANALYEHGKRREALTAYQGALAHDPNAPDALSKVAYIYLDKGDNARARRFAARAVELDPSSSEGWIVLGAALEALGDRSAARTAYRTCAGLGSGSYATECRKLGR
jgi:hypothetical protein